MKQTIIKVGDFITYKTWHGSNRSAIVEDIEICKPGKKYGRKVNRCDISKHSNGTLCLSDSSWCYFYQIIAINSVI